MKNIPKDELQVGGLYIFRRIKWDNSPDSRNGLVEVLCVHFGSVQFQMLNGTKIDGDTVSTTSYCYSFYPLGTEFETN